MAIWSTEAMCRELVEEVLQVALRRLSNLVPTNMILPVRPTFVAKRPPPPSLPAAKASRGEEAELRRRLEETAGSLQFAAREAEHWRSATEAARVAGERLASENNRLAEEAAELRGVAGEQARLCTKLAADLLDMVWALTGAEGPVVGELDALQLSSLCRLAVQALPQAAGPSAAREEVRLATALVGALVNLSGGRECLGVLARTEEGAEVVGLLCTFVTCTSTAPRLAELAMMVLVNYLGADAGHAIAPKAALAPEVLERLGAAAGRWRVGERGGRAVAEVAGKLALLVGLQGGGGGLAVEQ